MLEFHIEGLKSYFSTPEFFKSLQVSFYFHINIYRCRCDLSFLRFDIGVELIIYIQASCFLIALFQNSFGTYFSGEANVLLPGLADQSAYGHNHGRIAELVG